MLLSAWPNAVGQDVPRRKVPLDSLFVRDFSNRPTVRLYMSRKFNGLVVGAQDRFGDLNYRPNGHFNIGLGASYKRLTLNIGLPVPFAGNDVPRKGRTRFLDAQATLHSNKQATNLFLQVFKGYHITTHALQRLGWDQTTEVPYRPDLVQFNIGISSLRIVDHAHFSYRATFNQDAWQQRTKGTWLYGGYATYYVLNTDSTLIPTAIAAEFSPTMAVTQAAFLDLGPMGGYAHTFVYRKHWFLTLSGAFGAGPSVQRIELPGPEGGSTQWEVGPGYHIQTRAGIGYNSRYRYAGILFNQERIGYLFREQDRFTWNVGNFRIMLVQRLKDRPARVDRGLRWLKRNTPLPVP